MKLLWGTICWDWRIQWRQGLFVAALFVMMVWIVLFGLANDVIVRYLLPVMLYIDLSIFGFFFMAGLLYLEKSEGILASLAVTPLRGWHYLLAKLITLTTIGLVASLLIVIIIQPATVNWLALFCALILNSLFFTLASFILAVRYNAINEFMIPAIWLLSIAQLPFLDSFGIWHGWPLYLLPFQAALLLVRGAFEPLMLWQWLYALSYIACGIGVAFVWALRVFEPFVIRSMGEQG